MIKCRALKKATLTATPTKSSLPFKSSMAFGKATTRARRALHRAQPSTRRRRTAVIRKLCASYAVSPAKEQSGRMPEHEGAISMESIEAGKFFYQRDDISRQCCCAPKCDEPTATAIRCNGFFQTACVINRDSTNGR